MKKLFYLLLFLFAANFSFAGRSKIDSLKSLLQTARHDTNEVNTLLNLCKLERNYSTEDALNYGNKGLKLAEDLDWNDGIALANLRIGNVYTVQGDNNKALEYYAKALDIFRQKGNRMYVEYCQTDMANNYANLGDYPKALEYYRLSLEESTKIRDTTGIIANLNSIASVFKTLGDFPKSLDYYQKASMEAQNSGDSSEIASVLNNIGILYMDIYDTAKSMNFLNQSLQISKKISYNKLEAKTLMNIEKLFRKGNDTASKDLNDALAIYQKIGNNIGIGQCMEQLGLINDRQKKYSVALDHTLKAQEIFIKAGDKELLADNYEQAGTIYKDSLLFEKAEENYEKSLALAREAGIKERQRDVLDSLSNLYHILNQPEKELNAFKQYILLRDTIMNGDKAKAIERKEIEYNDLKTKIEEEKTKVAVERKHNLQLLGIAVFILSLIITVLLLSKIKVKHVFVKILGVFALLLLFEFFSLLIEPLIAKWTNDNPVYTFFALVALAAVLIPTHHRLEHWVKEHLTKHHHLKPADIISPEDSSDKNQPV